MKLEGRAALVTGAELEVNGGLFMWPLPAAWFC